MDLENKRKIIEEEIESLKRKIDGLQSEYEELKDLVQPSNNQLYKNMSDYVSIKQENGQYEYILGGDGRSSPFSEMRGGIIIKVKVLTNVYLSDIQKEIIKRYIEDTRENYNGIIFE